MHRAQAVGPGVAAAQNDDVAVSDVDRRGLAIAHRAIRRLEVRHCGVHAGQFRSRDRDEPGPRRTERQQHRVEVALQINERRCGVAHAHAGVERDARGRHHRQAAIEDGLFEFELRYAVAQEPADGVTSFEDVHLVADAGELGRGGEPGRAGADHGTRIPVKVEGCSATSKPWAKACSATSYSMRSMVTGLSEMPSTHADSHGAGQSRPVNSGKLLVSKSWAAACSQCER